MRGIVRILLFFGLVYFVLTAIRTFAMVFWPHKVRPRRRQTFGAIFNDALRQSEQPPPASHGRMTRVDVETEKDKPQA